MWRKNVRWSSCWWDGGCRGGCGGSSSSGSCCRGCGCGSGQATNITDAGFTRTGASTKETIWKSLRLVHISGGRGGGDWVLPTMVAQTNGAAFAAAVVVGGVVGAASVVQQTSLMHVLLGSGHPPRTQAKNYNFFRFLTSLKAYHRQLSSRFEHCLQ